jgi:hypothetical protein
MIAAAAAMAFASPAFAVSFVEARLASSVYEEELAANIATEVGFSKIETEGKGFSFRGQMDLAPSLFGRASYVFTSGDEIEVDGVDLDLDFDATVLRAGLGLQGSSENLRYYGALDYAKVKLEVDGEGDDENGYVLAGGLGDAGSGALLWNVELGYVDIGDSDGALLGFDIGYRFTPNLAVTLGYEGYSVEDDAGTEILLAHGFLGLRYQFQ